MTCLVMGVRERKKLSKQTEKLPIGLPQSQLGHNKAVIHL